MTIGSFIALKILGRAFTESRVDKTARYLRPKGLISKGSKDATPNDAAWLIYFLASTVHTRQCNKAFGNIIAVHTGAPGKRPVHALTFFTDLFCRPELIRQIREIRVSARNGHFTVIYFKDLEAQKEEGQKFEFISTDGDPNFDHDGKPFDESEVDTTNILTHKFLWRVYLALNDKYGDDESPIPKKHNKNINSILNKN